VTWWVRLLIDQVVVAAVALTARWVWRRWPAARPFLAGAFGLAPLPDLRHVLCPRCGLPLFYTRQSPRIPQCLCQEAPVTGFRNRILTLSFPDLTDEDEPILHVVLRNPKTVPPTDLVPDDLPTGPDGVPLDQALAAQRSREIIARLIIGWRMYDASDFGYDPETGLPTDQQPLPLPATPELVDRLPMDVIREINKVISEAVNPQSSPDQSISKTS